MSRNVMIVDDSATQRAMIRRALLMAGLEIGEMYEASTGIQALARLGEHEVAVILLDIHMPAMNGLQLLSRMRQHERLRNIPIVIASTEGSEERLEQLSALGVAGYLRKPFAPEQLRDVLKPLLGVKNNGGTELSADPSVF